METIVLILIVAVISSAITTAVLRNRIKSLSVSVNTTNPTQAKKLFKEKVGKEIPEDAITIIKHPTSTEFKLKLIF